MPNEKRLSRYVQKAVSLVKSRIDDNPSHETSIIELATDAGISRNLLQQGFKQIFGERIKDYRKRIRLETGKQLLQEGDMSMKQIAARCGYKSQNSFAKAFKKLYHVTPTEWQMKRGKVEVK